MKRLSVIGALAIAALGAGGLVAAQTPGSTTDADHDAHHPEKGAPKTAAAPKTAPSPMGGPQGGMGSGMMGGGGMGNGMMGCGMMGGVIMGGGMMGMMLGTGAKLDIKKMPKGVSMTIASDDAKVVARVQKMAEAMRLMHEATEQ
jgi:hypothetical protein